MSETIDPNAFRDFERSAHDRLADSYHAFFSSVTAHAAQPLLAAAKVGANTEVLDVACGSGVVAMHAARMGAHVTGVDLAPRMLELASRLNPGCTFREASVDSMPFDDETFDAIVCAFGIGHFPDPPAAVPECARVARAGSICAFAWWDLPARNQMHGVLLSALDEVKPEAPADLRPGLHSFATRKTMLFSDCWNPPVFAASAWPRTVSRGICRMPRRYGPRRWGAWPAIPPSSTRRRQRSANAFALPSCAMPPST